MTLADLSGTLTEKSAVELGPILKQKLGRQSLPVTLPPLHWTLLSVLVTVLMSVPETETNDSTQTLAGIAELLDITDLLDVAGLPAS